ncbi:MAG: Na/Pi cotransporter family protein [Candidatus Peribacteria bacterium]|nr:MAG: Na/Pi cotransporter family protein [Candidatus Peribacteria bacterium]
MNFLAGLAFFLVGLHLFEDQLKLVGSKTIKKLLEKYSKNPRSAGLMGMMTAASLQSQAATIVLAISFLGAGLIGLSSVIAIIIGANVGTTFTPWLISLLGFKFSITTAAIPILALGGLISVFFSKNEKIKQYALMAFGFGMAFFGLGMLKTSVGDIATAIDLTTYLDYPLIVYGLIGLVITALMQSSTAMNTINLTALFAGLIPFPVAAATSLGAELGTTISALLAARGDRRIKLQAALTQVAFNLVTVIICGLGMYYLIDFVSLWIDPTTNAPLALAALITTYNLVTALIILPFVKKYTTRIQNILPDHTLVVTRRTSYLDPTDATHQTVRTLVRDARYLHRLAIDFVDHVVGTTNEKRNTGWITHDSKENRLDAYHDIKLRHDQLIKFARNIPLKELSRPEDRTAVKKIIDALTGTATAAKYTKDIMIDLQELRTTKDVFLTEQYDYIRTHTDLVHTSIYRFTLDTTTGIDGLNEIITHINQRNGRMNQLRTLLGDASNVPDDLVSSQMNIYRRLQDTHRQLIYALHDIYRPDILDKDLHTIRQY